MLYNFLNDICIIIQSDLRHPSQLSFHFYPTAIFAEYQNFELPKGRSICGLELLVVAARKFNTQAIRPHIRTYKAVVTVKMFSVFCKNKYLRTVW